MDAYLDGLLDELVEVEPRETWDDVLRRAGRSHRILASRRAVVAALAAAAALTAGGLATARATGLLDFGPLHRATVYEAPTLLTGASGQVSTCDLIGKRAAQVEAALTSSGIAIEWRFQRWGDVVETTGDGSAAGDQQAAEANAHTVAVAVSGGNSETVSSVPSDSIVWSTLPDDQAANKAFVFVEAPDDPNAPTISMTGCP